MNPEESRIINGIEPDALRSGLFQQNPTGMVLVDPALRVIAANDAIFHSFGQEWAAPQGESFGNLFHCAQLSETATACGSVADCSSCLLHQAAYHALQTGTPARAQEIAYDDLYNGRRDRKWFLTGATPISFQGKQLVLLTFVDYTQARRREETLVQLGITDKLTGLFNQRYILDQLNKQLILLGTKKEPLTVVMAGIDGLKQISSTYGRSIGDLSMMSFAKTVRSVIRYSDYAGRYGSEELLLLLPASDEENSRHVIERIRLRLAPVQVGRIKEPISFSAGLLEIFPGTVGSPAQVAAIAQVSTLLKQARAEGKSGIASAKIQDESPDSAKGAEDEANAAL